MTATVASRILEVPANGLRFPVLEWSHPVPTRGIVLLLHGFMDCGASWDLVAPDLGAAGFRVLAPDLRGFGHAPRVTAGAYYHFADYIFDVADIVQAAAGPEEKVFVVGHSMGGTVATLFAGAFPERVSKLALLEGLGPPDNTHEIAPLRARRWIEEARAVRERARRPYPSMTPDEALNRLAGNHPSLPRELLATRVAHLTREIGAGRVVWRFDPLHKTMSPVPFFAETFAAFSRKIACPVLAVDGGTSGFHVPDEDARLGAYAEVKRVTLDGAGHMMHWTRPRELAGELVQFAAA